MANIFKLTDRLGMRKFKRVTRKSKLKEFHIQWIKEKSKKLSSRKIVPDFYLKFGTKISRTTISNLIKK